MCDEKLKATEIDSYNPIFNYIKKIEVLELGVYYYDDKCNKYGVLVDGELKPIPITTK